MRLLRFALTGFVLLMLTGPWLAEALFRFGFVIFSPNLLEDAALVVVQLLTFPAGIFIESQPMSRGWYALNGAVWGALVAIAWTGLVSRRIHDDA